MSVHDITSRAGRAEVARLLEVVQLASSNLFQAVKDWPSSEFRVDVHEIDRTIDSIVTNFDEEAQPDETDPFWYSQVQS